MGRERIEIAAGDRRVTGVTTRPGRAEAPLLLALHGGTYTSAYFDVPGLSFMDLAEATGFTAVSLDRPGYGGSDPLDDDTPFFAGSATVLDDAIAGLWADRAADHLGIVIVSHSIGSAIAVHMAAGKPGWPPLGIALHGVNDRSPDPVVNAWNAMPAGQPVAFTQEQRRMFMYGPDGTMDTDAVARAEISAAPAPLAELLEIVREWPASAAQLAAGVTVPVHYALAEFDGLWLVDEERVDRFAGYSTSAPWTGASLFRGAGHNIDHPPPRPHAAPGAPRLRVGVRPPPEPRAHRLTALASIGLTVAIGANRPESEAVSRGSG